MLYILGLLIIIFIIIIVYSQISKQSIIETIYDIFDFLS
jgi:hypothetical protein